MKRSVPRVTLDLGSVHAAAEKPFWRGLRGWFQVVAATSWLYRSAGLSQSSVLRGRLLSSLDVLFGDVVLEDADGGGPCERSVGSVMIVEVDESFIGACALNV